MAFVGDHHGAVAALSAYAGAGNGGGTRRIASGGSVREWKAAARAAIHPIDPGLFTPTDRRLAGGVQTAAESRDLPGDVVGTDWRNEESDLVEPGFDVGVKSGERTNGYAVGESGTGPN